MRLQKKIYVFFLVAWLTFICLNLLPKVSAQQSLPVHNVNTGYSYATIQGALDADSTLNGHVIMVDAGTYNEHILLSKSVVLVSQNPSDTIIDGQGSEKVIEILAANATIAGFTIRNSGAVSGSAGIHAHGADFCNVSQNRIESNVYGVWFESCLFPTVAYNNFTLNQNAIYVDNSDAATIAYNDVFQNTFAVWLSGDAIDFRMNRVFSNDYAIWITQCINLSLDSNQIVDNGDGVLVYNNSQTINLTGNDISAKVSYAVFINDCTNSSIDGNRISSQNKEAVYIQSSRFIDVAGNNVSSNGYDGIYLYQSNSNSIDNNAVTEARAAVAIYSSVGNSVLGNELSGSEQGIVLDGSRLTELLENVVRENRFGVQVINSRDIGIRLNDISQNVVDGLQIEGSRNNSVTENILSSNNGYALFLSSSINNTLSSNSVANSVVGIYLKISDSNIVFNNTVSNNGRGVSMEESSQCSLFENKISSNNNGLVMNASNNNLVRENSLTRNTDGITLYSSGNNNLESNVVSLNLGTGVHASDSNLNRFLHNSFFNNSLAPVSMNSSNIWDDGVEGNFWGYEGSTDSNRNGIADDPIVLSELERDRFPLMGPYVQLVAVMDTQEYVVSIVCNSSISDFRYFREPLNATSLISYRVDEFEGLGFCRICIPRTLIQPPFEVAVDNAPPLYQNLVSSNLTHSWLYFSFPYTGGSVRIVPAELAPPFWTELWFWGMVTLTIIVAALGFAIFRFYRRLGSYRKTIEEFEKRLRERETSPVEIARKLFSADVDERSAKISEFEEKYGVRLRPRNSLEDALRGLKLKKNGEKKDEVNS